MKKIVVHKVMKYDLYDVSTHPLFLLMFILFVSDRIMNPPPKKPFIFIVVLEEVFDN